ncbi:MAG: hypothetical protein K2K13_05840 [Clostridiales bacterium]|nr:hypothetical protein [Clostridiales bacterium]
MNDTNNKLNILTDMLKGGALTKNSIMFSLNVSERTARHLLSEIAKSYPLIALSDQCGYRIATGLKDLDDVRHAYNENRKRAAEILKRNKTLEKFMQDQGAAT